MRNFLEEVSKNDTTVAIFTLSTWALGFVCSVAWLSVIFSSEPLMSFIVAVTPPIVAIGLLVWAYNQRGDK